VLWVKFKRGFAALATAGLKSPPIRRLGVSLSATLALAVVPMLPAAAPAHVHIAMTPTAAVPWLDRFNAWRANTATSAVTENTTYSAGDVLHATYMVQTGQITHGESTAYPQYTVAGDIAGQNSNIYVSSSTGTGDVQAIDWWMGAPFHSMAMMDPKLATTGFGSYRNAAYTWQMGAALNTGQGRTAPGQYPVYFPGNGSIEPLTGYSGNEFPDPLQACPGASGLPLFIEVGNFVATTAGPVHTLIGNGVSLANCVIDSTNTTLAPYLTSRGGVIVFPQQPLQNGVRYVVALTVNGLPYTWSFTVGSSLIGTLPVAAVLPAMTNGAYGGYVTAATIQNIGSAAATVRIAYFDQNGAPAGAGDTNVSLPVNGSWTVRQDNGNSFPSSGGDAAQAGSAVVYSSQPLAAFVNEFAPGGVGDATSYSGVQVPSGVGTTLFAPTIVNNAFGGYTTGIGLINSSAAPTNITVTYRDTTGAAVKTQTVTALAAGAYQGLYSGDPTLALPTGFNGTASIASSAGAIAAIVNETGPGGQLSSYDAVPSGSNLLNVPVALNNAFGGYFTGIGIQNTSASGGSVSVTYYDAAGSPTVKNFTLPANGSLAVYQGSVTDGPAVGAYTALIQSALPLVAVVNEVAPSSTTVKQSTSYNAFSAGSGSTHVALVENAGSDPWNTGLGIMNTGVTSTTVTVSHFNAATGAAVGTPQTQTLASHAFWGLYQPGGGLPSGTRATAVITTSSGGQVAVICNESSSTTFMSYDAQ
jgi:hypothetical protein